MTTFTQFGQNWSIDCLLALYGSILSIHLNYICGGFQIIFLLSVHGYRRLVKHQIEKKAKIKKLIIYFITLCMIFNANFRVTKLIRRRLQFIFSENSLKLEEAPLFQTKSKNLTFSDILIDVSKYDDPRLLQKSLHLLNRYD